MGAVYPFDYPYMLAGRKRPDPLPQLISAHRLAFAGVVDKHAGPIVLVGKSMGGRVGCHLALQEADRRARLEISRELGHGRIDVTDTYLGRRTKTKESKAA
jgi:predicted alpha/beta-hydrolase family hydrolase